MLTQGQLQLIEIQLNLLHDCIRSIIYFHRSQEMTGVFSAWIYISDVLSEHLVQSWCKIFGTNSEPTHWEKISEEDEVKNIISPYNKNKILEVTSF